MERPWIRTPWLMLAPALLLLALVFLFPLLQALWLSFQSQNLDTQLRPVFAGLQNWRRLGGDSRLWKSLGQTLVFSVISVSFELLLGLGTALILNQSFRGRGLLRTIAILPWALPTAIISVAWVWIFNDQYGLMNDLLLRLGLISQGINWLGEQPWATTAVILADVWKTTPFITLILLAGLQAIPPELYEAHALDGAGPWQSFVRLTLPLLAPQIFIALLFRFAQAFGVFDLIQVMTGGGPAGSTETIAVYIYSMTMRYLDFGYGATLVAATFILLAGGLAVVAVAFKVLSKA